MSVEAFDGLRTGAGTRELRFARPMRRTRRKDVSEYRLLFAAAVAIFLVAAVVSRLLPWNWRVAGGAQPKKSVVDEAWDAANTALPYAFMS